MDSLTHIVLGAAIGDLTAGRGLGKKAMLYGAILGTLPDLDVAVGAFMNDVDKIIFHRGITHSLLFWLVMSPLCGWLIVKSETVGNISFQRASMMSFLILFTHALLDSFTSYGTRLLIPLTFDAYAFSTISIIDPLYSIWLFLAIPLVLIRKMDFPQRRKILTTALIISQLYLGATILNKTVVDAQLRQAFASQQYEIHRFISKPGLFSNLLWTGIAETNDGYYYASYPVLSGPDKIKVHYVEKNHELVADLSDSRALQRLVGVTEGYYTVEKKDNRLFVNDLRFGRVSAWPDAEAPFVFSYEITGTAENVTIERVPLGFDRNRDKQMIKDLFRQITG